MSNILQPTKADSPAPNKANEDKSVELIDEINRTLKPPAAPDTSSDTSSTKSAPGPETSVTILNPNQMLDLDLSFFEKSSSSSSLKSSSSSGGGGGSKSASGPTGKANLPTDPKSGGKPESNSIYLNKLLQDIFHQPQASQPPVPSSASSNGGVLKPNHKKQETTDKNCKR